MTAQQKLDKARAKYRSTYDRLYVASMRAGSAEECDRIDRQLHAANAEWDAAKAEYEGNGREHVGAKCTLDGVDATICGRRNDFATVAALPHGNRVEYAWPTVARVMDAGGGFRS